MYMCICCFSKFPLNTAMPIYWKALILMCVLNGCCLPILHEEKQSVRGCSLSSHEPCPSWWVIILNSMARMWPRPWRTPNIFLSSPCDGIIPVHLPPLSWECRSTQGLVELMMLFNGVHPHICYLQMLVEWHCAGGNVGRMESLPPHCQWLDQRGSLNKRKHQSKVGRELGISLRLLKHRYNFCSPSVSWVDGFCSALGQWSTSPLENHSQWGRAPLPGKPCLPWEVIQPGFGEVSPISPPHFFEKTFPYFVIDIFCAIFFFLGVRWWLLAYPLLLTPVTLWHQGKELLWEVIL